jgi:hypothetical protein
VRMLDNSKFEGKLILSISNEMERNHLGKMVGYNCHSFKK